MADDDFDDEDRGGLTRYVRIGIPVVVALVIVGAILYAVLGTTGLRREAPPIATMVATLPPPPPPPPPEKEKPPPPEEKKVEQQEQKVDQPKTEDQPKQITINGPAQAGTDAFGLAAGSGGGSIAGGGGLGDASYGNYLKSILQDVIQQSDALSHAVFSAEIAIWVDANGRVKDVKVIRSSGDSTTDQALVAALEGAPALEQPPSEFQFPQKVSVSGRRPG
jgi:TonB family protein